MSDELERDLESQIRMTHERFTIAMNDRLSAMTVEQKERYFAVLSGLAPASRPEKLKTVCKMMARRPPILPRDERLTGRRSGRLDRRAARLRRRDRRSLRERDLETHPLGRLTDAVDLVLAKLGHEIRRQAHPTVSPPAVVRRERDQSEEEAGGPRKQGRTHGTSVATRGRTRATLTGRRIARSSPQAIGVRGSRAPSSARTRWASCPRQCVRWSTS